MNRKRVRSLADCMSKEDCVTYLEMTAIHTKDTLLAGLTRTWKHLTHNTNDSHTVRDHGPVRASRLGLRERQIVSRINERLVQNHSSLGTVSFLKISLESYDNYK